MKPYLTYQQAEITIQKEKLRSKNEWYSFYKKNKGLVALPSNPYYFYKNNGWVNWNKFLGHGIKKEDRRKYTINKDFFKTWSSSMAYFLGFWWADGYMQSNKTGYHLIVSLAYKDKYILESFQGFLGSNSPIRIQTKKDKQYATLNVFSKTLIEDLILLGGKQNKSLDIDFPNVPAEYLADFIRGYFDGDGSIFMLKRNYVSTIVSSSKIFAEKLYKILTEKLKMPTDRKVRVRINKRLYNGSKNYTYVIQMCGRATLALGEYMYTPYAESNAQPKLIRKFNRFLELKRDFKPKQFLSYQQAKKYVHALGLKNWSEWIKWIKSGQRPQNLPAFPYGFYKDEFKGVKDWLGVVNG